MASIALQLSLDDIRGPDWDLSGLTLDVDSPRRNAMSVELRIEHINLPQDHGELRGVRLACANVTIDDEAWRCERGHLHVDGSPVEKQDTPWHGHWRGDGAIHIDVPKLTLARGTVALSLDMDDKGWRTGLRAYRLQIRRLAALGDAVELPRDWGIKGRVSGRVTLRGGARTKTRANIDLVADHIHYESPDDAQVAEGIVVKLDANARQVGSAWRFKSRLRWPKGQLYSEPLFIDAGTGALKIDASGLFSPQRRRMALDVWTVELGDALRVSGSGEFDTHRLDIIDLTMAAHSDDAGRLYEVLVQPFLVDTPGEDMLVSGRVGFVMRFDGRGLEQLGLELTGVSMKDHQGRFELRRTDGTLGWNRDQQASVSRLSTAGVGLLGIDSEAFSIKARFAADRVDLLEPVVVPVLDGQLALDRFALSGVLVAGEAPRWTAHASLRGISLDELTRRLDLPPFSGELSAELRDMHYADRSFSIGGGLQLRAFDGSIQVNDLVIREPLGDVPILSANARMRDLDLEAVTQTFAFGRIEGRLHGDLNGLQLVAWQPDHFDLHLYTPPDDDSRRRISQRAVENLTELGSGVPGGLSTSLLGLFEEFSYNTIDIRIGLRGHAADIDGLARDDGGYYLVRGSGLPRIDVIGRNRSVAWKDLLERLREIRVEGIQIQ